MGRNNQQRRAAKAKARAQRARTGRPGPGTPGSAAGYGGPGGAAGLAPDVVGTAADWWPDADWTDEEWGGDAWSDGGSWGERRRTPIGPDSDEPVPVQVEVWVQQALADAAAGRDGRVRASADRITALATGAARRREVCAILAARLVAAADGLWARGWRPDEIHRMAARLLDLDGQALVGDAMATSLSRSARSTVTPSWLAQLDALDAVVWWTKDTTFVEARARQTTADLAGTVGSVLAALVVLLTLPGLEVLDPLPGQWRPVRGDAAGPVDDRVLERVRALLAKAESTTFEAEADTFNAAAQTLMTRHSIDAAMLAASHPGSAGDGPMARRFGIDRPYETPKVMLLDLVASANRCRTVWAKELSLVTVVGFAPDLEAVETLFTSLLLQATRAVTGAGSRRYAGGQSRTRAFRAAFLTSYAQRIGERLQEASDAATAAAAAAAAAPVAQEDAGDAPHAGATRPVEAARRGDVALVLVERSAKVDEHVEELFPQLVVKRVATPSDAEGWHAGRVAADAATLFGGDALSAG